MIVLLAILAATRAYPVGLQSPSRRKRQAPHSLNFPRAFLPMTAVSFRTQLNS